MEKIRTKLAVHRVSCLSLGSKMSDNVPAFYYGTSPNKFFGYLASGIPVLNNSPGWLADLITENQCGIAVPPGDPNAFADALIRFADDKQTREGMGRNARQLGESQFDRGGLAGKMVQFLESIASQ